MGFRARGEFRLGFAMSWLLLVAAGSVVAARARVSDSVVGQPVASPANAATETPVQALVRYAGEAIDQANKRVPLRFSVYETFSSTSVLWSESQNVTVGPDGKYSVLLGAGSSAGLPQSIFAAGETRWLAVSLGDSPETAKSTPAPTTSASTTPSTPPTRPSPSPPSPLQRG